LGRQSVASRRVPASTRAAAKSTASRYKPVSKDDCFGARRTSRAVPELESSTVPSPADQIIELYEHHALDWDRGRGRGLLEAAWLDRFLAALPATPAAILDIGCGAAEPMARYCIEKGHRVTGIDASPSLIEMCRNRFPDHDWLTSDMRAMALGRRFHGLLAWDSFFHLAYDDQRRMFPVFRAHAAENAALMFTSGPAHGEAIGSFQGKPLYHGSLDPSEYRQLLDDNGFDVVTHIAEDPTCGGHTIWLARLR